MFNQWVRKWTAVRQVTTAADAAERPGRRLLQSDLGRTFGRRI